MDERMKIWIVEVSKRKFFTAKPGVIILATDMLKIKNI